MYVVIKIENDTSSTVNEKISFPIIPWLRATAAMIKENSLT